MDRVPGPPAGLSPPVFSDGFGARFLTFDSEAGPSEAVEILSFESSLVDAPEFAEALGARVARLAGARHTSFARVRRLDRPAADSLLLVSDRVAGWRLAQVLDLAEQEALTFDISAVLSLLRQLVPAVALFARHQKDIAVGGIGPERLILTPQGRLVLAEYVLGPAIEKLGLSRDQLWRHYRVAVPAIARVTPRADVLSIGIVVLSLLLGRRLRDDEYPGALPDLLQAATESSGGNVRMLSEGLKSWLARALQLDARTAFQSPQEAQVAFEEMLAAERGYVTSPALLDAFVARFVTIAGRPPEAVRPAPEPPVPEPVPEPVPDPPPPAVVEEAPPEPQAAIVVNPDAEAVVAHAPSPMPDPVELLVAAPLPTAAAPEPLPLPVGIPEPVVAPGLEGERDLFASPVAEPVPSWTIAPPPPEESVEAPGVRLRVGGEARRWTTGALAGFALIAVIQAIAIIWLWNRWSDTLAREGELEVKSLPTAARVRVDDRDLGVTPLTVRLAPGTYTLQVQAGAAPPRVLVVQIRPGVQTSQYLELQVPDAPAEKVPGPTKGRKN